MSDPIKPDIRERLKKFTDAHLKATGKLPDEMPPSGETPAGLRWWAKHCASYGGLERAFNEAAAALEKALAKRADDEAARSK